MVSTVETGAADTKLGYRPGLDQLRAVAVVLVVLAHTIERPQPGTVGVVVFFVLSGFLITRLLLEEQDRSGGIGLGGFYRRRAWRLLPPLGLALALGAVVNYRLGAEIRAPVVAALTYTSNFAGTGNDEGWAAMTHLWTLAVEEHFYVVWPLVLIVVPRRRLLAVCVAGAATVVVARFGADPLHFRHTWFRVDAMLIGAALAVAMQRLVRPPRPLVVLAGGFVLWFCGWGAGEMRWGFTALALASAVLVADAIHWREVPALRRVGVLSYGVYLFHLPVQEVVKPFIYGGWVYFAATLAVTLLIAEVSYRCIEAPAIRLGRSGSLVGDVPRHAVTRGHSEARCLPDLVTAGRVGVDERERRSGLAPNNA